MIAWRRAFSLVVPSLFLQIVQYGRIIPDLLLLNHPIFSEVVPFPIFYLRLLPLPVHPFFGPAIAFRPFPCLDPFSQQAPLNFPFLFQGRPVSEQLLSFCPFLFPDRPFSEQTYLLLPFRRRDI